MCVYPLGLLRVDHKISSGDTEAYGVTPALNPGSTCSQAFIAQENYLKELSFAFSPLDSLPKDTRIVFSLLDEGGKTLVSKTYTGEEIVAENYCTVAINKWIKKGSIYSYQIKVDGTAGNHLVLYTTPNPVNFAAGNIALSFNGVPLEGQAYTLFLYTAPLNKKDTLCVWALLFTITMSIYSVITLYLRGKQC